MSRTRFALDHAPDGTVTRAFTPDFFLPEIGIYVECTVARSALTTRKRQKARAAERLYGIVTEIAYRTDFENMARRWTLRELPAHSNATHRTQKHYRWPLITPAGLA